MLRTLLGVALIGFAVAMSPQVAQAGSSDTGDVACGWSSAGWDAPKGAVVSTKAPGPILEVITSIGEVRTHNMVSHGPGAEVTHATMHAPGTNGWPTYCSRPLRANELAQGFPGSSRVSQGGIYTYLYLTGSTPEFLRTQVPTTGTGHRTFAEGTADWLLYNASSAWVTSKKNSGQGLYRIGPPGQAANMPYSLYQYRSEEARVFGNDSVWNGGIHCTTMVAWAYRKYRGSDDYIATFTYGHSTVINAGNALKSGVEASCNSGTSFWTDFGSAITCFEGICDDMGRQVRNCMAYGGCDTDSSSTWNSMSSDPNVVATSLSPDDLLGWSGHTWTGGNVGPWAPYGYSTTNWNSGGNVYGCWF